MDYAKLPTHSDIRHRIGRTPPELRWGNLKGMRRRERMAGMRHGTLDALETRHYSLLTRVRSRGATEVGSVPERAGSECQRHWFQVVHVSSVSMTMYDDSKW